MTAAKVLVSFDGRPKTIRVHLSDAQIEYARDSGRTRNTNNEAAGRKEVRDRERGRWGREHVHILGALAEVAFGYVFTGKEFPPIRTEKPERGKPEFGVYQIRSSTRSWGRMVLHNDDHEFVMTEDGPTTTPLRYVLVTPADVEEEKDPRTFKIRGWIGVSEGRLPSFWDDPSPEGNRGAFFVPADVLKPFSADEFKLFKPTEVVL